MTRDWERTSIRPLSRRLVSLSKKFWARERVDDVIKELFALNMPRRIDEAKRAHDLFMAKTFVLFRICDQRTVGAEINNEVVSLRNKAANAGYPFDNDFVSAEAAAWEKVREALRQDANAPLPD
jgi:hypothetical protein